MPIISTLRWALAESANHDFPYERIAEGLAADEVDSGMPYRDLSLAKNRTFVKNDAEMCIRDSAWTPAHCVNTCSPIIGLLGGICTPE